MLTYFARMVPLVLRARRHRDGALVSRLARRVLPSEIDANLHMNQAVYAHVGELGRTDWVIRSGAWDQWRATGVSPVVAEQTIVYRRELKPLQRYEIDSRAVGFEGRLLVLESYILVGDRVHTKLTAKLIFIGEDGVISAEATEAACAGLTTTALPIEDWSVRPGA